MSNFTGGSIPGTKKYKKDKEKAKENPIKTSDSAAKAAWLKKTRNSPAAKAGISDEKRWALQQRKQAFDASRKAKKSKTKSTSTKSKSTTGSTKTSTNKNVKTKVTSSKGKTTYETSKRAKGLAGLFGKKRKTKLTVPNLSNLK